MMDRNVSNKLLAIAVGGLILLLVSIFGEAKDHWTLSFALAAISLANLFNLIRLQRTRREERESGREKATGETRHE